MRAHAFAAAAALWAACGAAGPGEEAPDGGAGRLEALRAERARLIEEAKASIEAPADRKGDDVKRAAQDRVKLEKEEKRRREEEARKRAEELRKRRIVGVETILDTGDSSRRVDIVLVGDGWTEKEIPEYRKTCQTFVDYFTKRVPPIRDYAGYINIHRVDGVCAESQIPVRKQKGGLESQGGGKAQETLCGTQLEEQAMSHPILTSNPGQARGFVQGVVRDIDFVAVIANTGTGRATGTMGANHMTLAKGGMDRTTAHEFGHAFGALADEYVDNTISIPQSGPNVTTVSDPLKAPWHYWNVPEAVFRGESAPLKFDMEKRAPSVEGGGLKAKGVWRPELRCLMNTDEFYCSVCHEHMEKLFHGYVRLIDAASPAPGRLTLFSNETAEFSMSPLEVRSVKAPSAEAGYVRWFVDGDERKSGRPGNKGDLKLPLSAMGLKPGWHTVSCAFDYPNARIRKEEGMMSDSRTWEVEVLPWPRPHFKMKTTKYRASPGKAVSIPIDYEPSYDPKEVEFRVGSLPEGAKREGSRIDWTPTEAQCGAWRIVLSFHRAGKESVEALEEEVRAMKAGGKERVLARYVEGDRTELERKEVWIEVPPLSAQGNTGPRLAYVPTQEVTEGSTLRLPLRVWEPDGDRLLFSSARLPAGARLDPDAGILAWTPESTQGGLHPVEISVTDGVKPDRISFDIHVVDKGGGSGGRRGRRGIPIAAEASDPGECREAKIRRAGRDLRNPSASAGALAALKELLRPAAGKPPSRSYEEGPPAREVDATDYRILAQTLAVGKCTWTWSMVDLGETRNGLKEICEQALARKDLSGDTRDVFKRILLDLAAIAAYDQRRSAPSK